MYPPSLYDMNLAYFDSSLNDVLDKKAARGTWLVIAIIATALFVISGAIFVSVIFCKCSLCSRYSRL